MMAATVGCGFPRQPCSPWSEPGMSPATDRLAEGHCSVTQPCSGLSFTFSQMVRSLTRGGRTDFRQLRLLAYTRELLEHLFSPCCRPDTQDEGGIKGS